MQQRVPIYPSVKLWGFTLVEIFIVVAIVVAISLVGFGSFSSQRDTRTLALETEKITTALRTTQQRSITQEDGEVWGIRFTNSPNSIDYFEIFKGSSYAPASVVERVQLHGDVGFSSPASGATADIVFESSTGAVASNFSLDIGSTRAMSLANAITVNTVGVVEVITTSTPSSPPPTPPVVVYDDVLQSSWINASWDNVIDFSNTNPVTQGTYSVSASSTNGWSAFQIRSGPWGGGIPVNIQGQSYLQFLAYGYTGGTPLRIYFDNDGTDSFPRVCFTGANVIPAGTWTLYSIPLSNLNPNNFTIHSILFTLQTATKHKWYIDNLRFSADQIQGALAGVSC